MRKLQNAYWPIWSRNCLDKLTHLQRYNFLFLDKAFSHWNGDNGPTWSTFTNWKRYDWFTVAAGTIKLGMRSGRTDLEGVVQSTLCLTLTDLSPVARYSTHTQSHCWFPYCILTVIHPSSKVYSRYNIQNLHFTHSLLSTKIHRYTVQYIKFWIQLGILWNIITHRII